MTIRITKQGKHPNKDLMVGTCGKCGTEIECERGDTTTQMVDYNVSERGVKCPTCKGWIKVKEKGQPAIQGRRTMTTPILHILKILCYVGGSCVTCAGMLLTCIYDQITQWESQP